MRISMLLPVLALAACGDKSGETVVEEEVEADTGNWWEVGGDSDEESGDGSDDSEDEEKPDDTAKPDDDAGGKAATWLATVSLASGEGVIEITSDDGEGSTCELSYPITESVEADGCSSCTFAYELTLGAAEVSNDGGGCEEWLGLDSEPLLYGQGDASAGEYGGIEFFNLYGDSGTGWAEVDAGYSSHQQQGTDDEFWEFGLK